MEKSIFSFRYFGALHGSVYSGLTCVEALQMPSRPQVQMCLAYVGEGFAPVS